MIGPKDKNPDLKEQNKAWLGEFCRATAMSQPQALDFLIRFYEIRDIQALILQLRDKQRGSGFTPHEINQLSVLYTQISTILFPTTRF